MTGLHLPTLNAALNAGSAALLVLGYAFIKNKRVQAHRVCMSAALTLSALFLASYLYYHYQVGSVRFQGQGPIRVVYFAILLSHTVLAMLNLPMVLRTLYLALAGRFEEHRKAARWAYPVWLYVSVTGVVVYWMLYRL